ncbi:MFS transporter [Ascoidea rubescens DSM 1968]|uniref:Multidrug resistance protein 4 n=1 Tax=Ascoidea rubescens DSM 1968 TaxID=1344418 RepID=A0A1D2VK50_9ASCO|nr:multidrug resistance protein 4 [Ascoidea rubescens DSM 1968]ODV61990.1 multidrug resistance protein 4 [Ascoidea rubescens DSM 1968]
MDIYSKKITIKSFSNDDNIKIPENNIVDWDGDDDPMKPINWEKKRKVRILIIGSLYGFLSPACSSMLSPAVHQIAKDFNVSSASLISFFVSVYVLAWAIIPLIVSPLAEMYGKKHIINFSIVFMFVFNMACALSQNAAQLIIFRFLAGCGSSAPITVGPSIIGDLFHENDRTLWSALVSIGPIAGPTISPVIAGFVVENLSWRWVFWIQLILNGVIAFFGLIIIEETYPPTILLKKAKKLMKLTNNPNLKTIYNYNDNESKLDKIKSNITRPLQLLIFHPMIYGLGAYMALMFALIYVLICTFPTLWQYDYNFSTGITGLMYLSLGIGYFLALPIWGILTQKGYLKLVKNNNNVSKPEFRLQYLWWSGIGAPITFLIFGWTAEYKTHWIVPAIMACLFAFFIMGMFQTSYVYLIDMNPRFSASSVAAVTVFRSVLACFVPLFAPDMFDSIGYGWSHTIFAIIAFLLGTPFPFYVYKNGENLRERANKKLEKSFNIIS